MPYEIKYNSKNKRYVVFETPPPGKKGLWKIKKSCKTRREAEDWVDEQEKKKRRRRR